MREQRESTRLGSLATATLAGGVTALTARFNSPICKDYADSRLIARERQKEAYKLLMGNSVSFGGYGRVGF